LNKQTLFEALDWALFSVGGILTAFLLPSTIFVTLLLRVPIPEGPISSFWVVPVAKIYLFFLLVGASWHAMHRIRFILFGFGLSRYRRGVTVLTTLALALTIASVLLVVFSL